MLSADNSITEICAAGKLCNQHTSSRNAVEHYNGSSPAKATGSTGVAGTPLRDRTVTFLLLFDRLKVQTVQLPKEQSLVSQILEKPQWNKGLALVQLPFPSEAQYADHP